MISTRENNKIVFRDVVLNGHRVAEKSFPVYKLGNFETFYYGRMLGSELNMTFLKANNNDFTALRWRLPTLKELRYMIEFSRGYGVLDFIFDNFNYSHHWISYGIELGYYDMSNGVYGYANNKLLMTFETRFVRAI